MPTLTYYGHSAWKLADGPHTVLIDPFITGNPHTDLSPESGELACDFIIVTHGHGDHLGDTIALSRRHGATVVANYEIARYCEGKLVGAHGMHLGGAYEFPFGRVKLVPALHGSSIEDEAGMHDGGNPTGVVVSMGGRNVYHAGDTGVFGDMRLIGELDPLDVALLPIGDNFTMGPRDAVVAARMLRARLTIPMHYGTFPVIEQDPDAFVEELVSRGLPGLVVHPGESLEV